MLVVQSFIASSSSFNDTISYHVMKQVSFVQNIIDTSKYKQKYKYKT